MKRIDIQKSFLLILFCSFVLFSYKLHAQNNLKNENFNINRVGAIDVGYVLRYSKATDRVRVLLDEKRKEFQKEFLDKELKLAEEEKKLKLKKEIMSKQAYKEAVLKFQNEVAKVQKQIQQKKRSLDNAFQNAQEKIRELTLKIIEEIAKKNNLDFVFNRENISVFKQHYDITKLVLKNLDERTKNATFTLEEKQPEKKEKK